LDEFLDEKISIYLKKLKPVRDPFYFDISVFVDKFNKTFF